MNDPTTAVQRKGDSSHLPSDITKGGVASESNESAGFQGNDKLLFGIILGVITFWLFAQTTLNIAPDMGKDRKSTRLNSSHGYISYAVFCLKKKKNDGTSAPQHFSSPDFPAHPAETGSEARGAPGVARSGYAVPMSSGIVGRLDA